MKPLTGHSHLRFETDSRNERGKAVEKWECRRWGEGIKQPIKHRHATHSLY